jgi:hypothetical protein
MDHQDGSQAGCGGALHETVKPHLRRRQVQTVQVDVGLDGKVPPMQATKQFRRHPLTGAFSVFGRMFEHKSTAGLHQPSQLPDRFAVRILCGLGSAMRAVFGDCYFLSVGQGNHIGHGILEQLPLFDVRQRAGGGIRQTGLGQSDLFADKQAIQGFEGPVCSGRSTMGHGLTNQVLGLTFLLRSIIGCRNGAVK